MYVKRSRTDRDAKNARNENKNEMNAKSEFALGRSKGVVIPDPSSRVDNMDTGQNLEEWPHMSAAV